MKFPEVDLDSEEFDKCLEIFQAVQDPSGNEQLVECRDSLKALFPEDAESCWAYLQPFVATCMQKLQHPPTERVMNFITSFVTDVLDENEDFQVKITHYLLQYLIIQFSKSKKEFRIQASVFIRELVTRISEQFEINATVFSMLEYVLSKRVKDKNKTVRQNVVLSLARFQTGPECDVTTLLADRMSFDPASDVRSTAISQIMLSKFTLDALMDRIFDKDAGCRLQVVRRIYEGVQLRHWKRRNRVGILKQLLFDKDAEVRAIAANCGEKFISKVKYNPIQFLKILPITSDNFRDVALVFSKILSNEDVRKLVVAQSVTPPFSLQPLDEFTPYQFVYWLSLLISIKSSILRENLHEKKAYVDEEEQSLQIFNGIKEYLPQTTEEIVELIVHLDNRIQFSYPESKEDVKSTPTHNKELMLRMFLQVVPFYFKYTPNVDTSSFLKFIENVLSNVVLKQSFTTNLVLEWVKALQSIVVAKTQQRMFLSSILTTLSNHTDIVVDQIQQSDSEDERNALAESLEFIQQRSEALKKIQGVLSELTAL